jgi:hypothetical protein
MKRFVSFVFMGILLVAPGALAEGQSRLGTDPAGFNRQLEAALASNDVDFLKAAAADDLKFTLNTGGTWTKAQWVDFMAKAQFASRNLVEDQVEVHGDVVVATARTHIRYTDPKRRPSEQVQQRTYQRGPRGWQLVSLRTIKEGALPDAPAGADLGSDPSTFNKQFETAMLKNDVAFMDALLADDWYLTANDPTERWDPAKRWDKKRWLDRVRTTKYASRDIVDEVVERHGNLVIATSRVMVKYTDPQQRGLDMTQQRFYVQGQRGWRMVSMRTTKEIVLPASTR